MFFHWLVADIKMITRNRQALFWALAFPLIFVMVFGLFDLDRPRATNVAVIDQSQDQVSKRLVEGLAKIDLVKVVSSLSEAEARKGLLDGDFGFVLIIPPDLMARALQGVEPVSLTLLYSQSQPDVSHRFSGVIRQFVDRANLELNDAKPRLAMNLEGVESKQISYFDTLLPGLVGMGIMTFSVIGMGSVIAAYRENRIFKRLLTTPLRVSAFFAAEITARLLLSVVQALIIFAAGIFLFNAHIYGPLLWALVLVIPANIIFLNLGFIVGAFAKNVEAASSLGNLMTLPMMFFSGTFFPTDSLPRALAWVVGYLPLTPLLDAMRGILLESRPLWAFPGDLAILGAWVIASSFLAVRFFRFE